MRQENDEKKTKLNLSKMVRGNQSRLSEIRKKIDNSPGVTTIMIIGIEDTVNFECRFGKDKAKLLRQLLADYPFIVSVDLSNSIFDDDSIELIVDLIQSNPTLRKLNLTSCFPIEKCGEYVRSICQAIATDNSTITSLNLSGNLLDDDSVKSIIKMIKLNATLRKLNLTSCFPEEGNGFIDLISEAIATSNITLTDVEYNVGQNNVFEELSQRNKSICAFIKNVKALGSDDEDTRKKLKDSISNSTTVLDGFFKQYVEAMICIYDGQERESLAKCVNRLMSYDLNNYRGYDVDFILERTAMEYNRGSNEDPVTNEEILEALVYATAISEKSLMAGFPPMQCWLSMLTNVDEKVGFNPSEVSRKKTIGLGLFGHYGEEYQGPFVSWCSNVNAASVADEKPTWFDPLCQLLMKVADRQDEKGFLADNILSGLKGLMIVKKIQDGSYDEMRAHNNDDGTNNASLTG